MGCERTCLSRHHGKILCALALLVVGWPLRARAQEGPFCSTCGINTNDLGLHNTIGDMLRRDEEISRSVKTVNSGSYARALPQATLSKRVTEPTIMQRIFSSNHVSEVRTHHFVAFSLPLPYWERRERELTNELFYHRWVVSWEGTWALLGGGSEGLSPDAEWGAQDAKDTLKELIDVKKEIAELRGHSDEAERFNTMKDKIVVRPGGHYAVDPSDSTPSGYLHSSASTGNSGDSSSSSTRTHTETHPQYVKVPTVVGFNPDGSAHKEMRYDVIFVTKEVKDKK